MTTMDFRAKRISEMIEGFSETDTSETLVNEDDFWPVYDFKRNQKYLLPWSTAVNFFKELCQGVQIGVSDDNGEPLYYFGECLENIRPLRIRFQASLIKTDDEGENVLDSLYKILISCMVMTLRDKFELTERGLEYGVCGVMYSTDLQANDLDVTVHFPYCRLSTKDFKTVFLPSFCQTMDGMFGRDFFKERFTAAFQAEDIIHSETKEDYVPFFGCVSVSKDEPTNMIETWYVSDIPKTIEEIFTVDISRFEEEEEDDQVKVEDHVIFKKNLAVKPNNSTQKLFWKPLIYTNSFCDKRLSLKSPRQGEAGPSRSRGISKESPIVRDRQQKLIDEKRNMDFEETVKTVIQYVKRHKTLDGIPKDKQDVVVNCVRHKMKNNRGIRHQIHTLVEEITKIWKRKEAEEIRDDEGNEADGEDAPESLWFDTKTENKPPIQVGNEGFFLPFNKLFLVLDRLASWRYDVTAQLEDIACIIYTMARTYDEKKRAKQDFVDFVQAKNPSAYRKRGSEEGLGELFNRQKERAVKKRITFWSLLHMFEEDDELYFNLWWLHICDFYIFHALDNEMASFSVARAASLLLVGRFMHTTGDAKQTWWKYTGTYWKNIHDTQSIELALTTTFIEAIDNVRNRYGTDSPVKPNKKANFDLLQARLSESSFRNNIVKDMSNIFLRDNRLLTFAAGTDPEYSNFFATINHVYYYSDGEMHRRKGHWEDFLTRAFDVIDEQLSLNDPKCQFILNWVHKMLRDPATEHEFLKDLASFLRGFNRDKRFSVWYGHGNGGKSKFMDLVCSTLGLVDGYAVKFPLETLLEGAKKSAGAASPEIDQGRGAFLAVLDEPKKGQKFDAGKIKAITGNDAMYTRTLFSKGGSFRPMFKTVLLGNVLPKADYDMAMKIRFWVWWFRGRFAEPEECPSTPEEQERQGIYPLDKDLDNKLPQYKSAMLSIMLHYYKLYCKEGVRRTEGIRRATDLFWNAANDVICFLSEQTVQTNDMETYATIDDLYDGFRRWFMNRNHGDRVLSKILFMDELEAIYTTQKIKDQGGIAGIRLRDGV